jgi:hypothetical protein
MSVLINASTSTGLVQSADTSGEIELQSNGTTALKVNTNEGIQILNCLGVGNATPSTSGAGITFPATQSASSDANTLDDYEEGTYTATLTPSGSGTITLTSGERTLSYTKIGRQVTVTGYVSVNSVSSPTGSSVLFNLPFTAATGTQVVSPVVIAGNVYGSSKPANMALGSINANTTTTNVYDGTINSIGAGSYATYIIAGTDFRIFITYFTA